MDAEENQKQVFPRRPQPLEIAARFPHSHRRDEAVEVENQKQVFPLSTATGWLFRPNSERRPGGGASLLLQAHCSIRKCSWLPISTELWPNHPVNQRLRRQLMLPARIPPCIRAAP